MYDLVDVLAVFTLFLNALAVPKALLMLLNHSQSMQLDGLQEHNYHHEDIREAMHDWPPSVCLAGSRRLGQAKHF